MSHSQFSITTLPGTDVVIKLSAAGTIVDADEIQELQAWANDVKHRIQQAYNSGNKPVLVLVDLTKLENYSEGEAISIFAELMKADNPYIKKTATFGASKKIFLAEKIAMLLAERENLRSFGTEEAALAWLRSDSAK